MSGKSFFVDLLSYNKLSVDSSTPFYYRVYRLNDTREHNIRSPYSVQFIWKIDFMTNIRPPSRRGRAACYEIILLVFLSVIKVQVDFNNGRVLLLVDLNRYSETLGCLRGMNEIYSIKLNNNCCIGCCRSDHLLNNFFLTDEWSLERTIW